MRSFFATLRQLVIPAGAQPGTPRIVIGPNVPAALTTTFFTPSAAIIWYQDATSYFFIATGIDTSTGIPRPRVLSGTVDPLIGLTVVNVYSPGIATVAFGTTVHDANTLEINFTDASLHLQTGSGLEVSPGAEIFLDPGSDLIYAGDSVLNWQPWTPLPTGTMNFGAGAATGQFVRVGQTYDAEAIITLGAGFAIGDAAVSLPATPSAGITYDLGTASYTDTSTGQVYFGRCRRIGTGMRFEYINAAGQYAVVTGALPFAFAAADVIRINSVRFHV